MTKRKRASAESEPVELIEPTADEKRNGWTAETLTAYRAEQEQRTQSLLDWGGRPKKRPTMQTRYRPWRFRWGD